MLLNFRCRATVEEITAEQCGIGGGDTYFRMNIVHGRLLKSRSLGHNLGALISKVIILGLGGGVTIEVVAAERRAGRRRDGLLGMEEGPGEGLEGTRVRQDAQAFRESFVECEVFCGTRAKVGGW